MTFGRNHSGGAGNHRIAKKLSPRLNPVADFSTNTICSLCAQTLALGWLERCLNVGFALFRVRRWLAAGAPIRLQRGVPEPDAAGRGELRAGPAGDPDPFRQEVA